MRTTLNLNDALARAAKKHAAGKGRSLTSLIEEALWSYLQPPRRATRSFRLRLVTKKGRRVPRLNRTDRDALYDHMEDRR